MTDYLTVIEIVAIHNEMIERFGGSHGIRDAGAIEAACYRPQSGYYNDIVQEAAALLESLAVNHPFIDGNKRVAFAAADIFLRINGYKIEGNCEKLHIALIELFDTKHFEIKYLEPLLRKHVTEKK